MSDCKMDDFEQLPDDVTLAVEIIRQIENLGYDPETILNAMSHICLDTLAKLPADQRKSWQEKLSQNIKNS